MDTGQHGNHPDVTDEDIGRRTVEIRRERATERAIELIRTHISDEWPSLTTHDVEQLEFVLGELWSHMSRVHWESVTFSDMDLMDVQELLDLAAQMSNATYGTSRYLDKMALVLDGKSREAREAAAMAALEAQEAEGGL